MQRKNIKGQISIFLALVFIVLFTLFGTTISVGMFIHDKINLQNASDLASYYVATKQAELLGAIAHSNYQIRQSLKLLTFRYRVFSNASRTESAVRHPGIIKGYKGFYNNHNPYNPASYHTVSGTTYPPRVCIWSGHIFKEVIKDSPCKKINFSASYIPDLSVIIDTGGIGDVSTGIGNTNQTIANVVEAASYANWWFAHTIVGAHRMEQRDRRAVIHALAENLSKPIVEGPDGMLDLEGGSIYEGALKTFQRNLSESNREKLGEAKIQITNSMEGLRPNDWLVPVHINLSLPVSFYRTAGSVNEEVAEHASDSFAATVSGLVASSPPAQTLKNMVDPDNKVRYAGKPMRIDAEPFLELTLGVEKNPWYMVYNKVEVQATSTPVFLLRSVFQNGIPMRAQSYAKPFGGRIGPWYHSQWPAGSNKSTGGEKTDEHLPQRVERAQLGSFSPGNFDPGRLPNFSRYPKDPTGLSTKSSMVAYGPMLAWDYGTLSPGSVQDFAKTVYSYLTGGNMEHNDPLAQDISESDPTDYFYRRMEIAAIAPDIFDVTHYSIAPGFYDYFIKDKLDKWLPSRLPQGKGYALKGDIGSHSVTEEHKRFDIWDQWHINTQVQAKDNSYGGGWSGNVTRSRRPIPWLNNPNKVSFLSSWNTGSRVLEYPDPNGMEGRFAACKTSLREDSLKNRIRTPSECLDGGRVGYSVKLISKKYLEGTHPIGGVGLSGSIKNGI